MGLTDVSVSSDGSMIYVSGVSPSEPKGCCTLYSIDLATLQMNRVVPIRGTDQELVVSQGIAYRILRSVRAYDLDSDLYRSPDGYWIFGVLNSLGRIDDLHGPVVDVFDMARGSLRELTPTSSTKYVGFSGTGSNDRFYFLIPESIGASARLWIVSPESDSLGDGVQVEPFAQTPACPLTSFALEKIAAIGDSVFIYEHYGSVGDRRVACSNLAPGGAWRVDPGSGHLLQHIVPDLHFSVLIADRTRPVLYGLAPGGPNWESPVELISIDARDGRTLQSRTLDSGFWTISMASLRGTPSGEVRATLSR
jgi:hypothetical protein